MRSIVAHFRTESQLQQKVHRLFEVLKFKPADEVLIKPNLVAGGLRCGIATNVDVLDAIIGWLRARGVKKIILGEGSGCEPTPRAFRKSGYGRLDIDEFVDFNNDPAGFVRAKVKNALEWSEIEVARTFYDAKCVINVPVAKIHHMAGVSLGAKNLLGVLKPGDKFSPHGTKAHIHREWSYDLLPDDVARRLFQRRLLDLLRVRKIDLTIIDGTIGLQKYETSRCPIKSNFILGSRNVLAADKLCARIMGYDLRKLYYLKLAQKLWGPIEYRVIGDKIKKFKFKI